MAHYSGTAVTGRRRLPLVVYLLVVVSHETTVLLLTPGTLAQLSCDA